MSFQTLKRLTPGHPKPRKPSKPYLSNLYPEDAVIQIMTESLISGNLKAFNPESYEPPIDYDHKNPGPYFPEPGRCLWTWNDLLSLFTARQLFLDQSPLAMSAKRPSYDQVISPRLAAVSQNMNWGALNKCINAVTNDDVPYTSLYGAMESLDYGATRKPLTSEAFTPLPTKQSDLSKHLRYSMPKADYCQPDIDVGRTEYYKGVAYETFMWLEDENPQPVHPTTTTAQAIYNYPPYPTDLGPRLLKHWSHAQQKLIRYAEKANPQNDASRAIRDDPDQLSHLRDRVIDRFLNQEWSFHALHDPDAPVYRQIEDAALFALIQQRVPNRARLSAPMLIGLSLLTGISPDVWVRYSYYFLERTHHCYIPEQVIADLIQWASKNDAHDLHQELQRLKVDTTRLLDDDMEARSTSQNTPAEDVHLASTEGSSFHFWGITPGDEYGLNDD